MGRAKRNPSLRGRSTVLSLMTDVASAFARRATADKPLTRIPLRCLGVAQFVEFRGRRSTRGGSLNREGAVSGGGFLRPTTEPTIVYE